MDYEKKYKEEVVRATQLWECGDITREQLEYIFPELKESEDERIRKELLKHCTNAVNGVTMCVSTADYARWLAWLERQGEQKSAWSEEDKKKINRIYQLIAEAADEHAFSTTCRLIGDKECVELQDFLRSLKPQPVQEWSEDDDEKFRDVIRFVEQGAPVQSYRDHYTNWLKSLKKRIGG